MLLEHSKQNMGPHKEDSCNKGVKNTQKKRY